MHLINDAVTKNAKHQLVIFVDTNLPFKWAERVLGRQAKNALSRPIQSLLDAIKKEHKGTDPYCMIVFSNHSHHYGVRDLHPGQHLLSVISQQPKVHLLALKSLHTAADLYGSIPVGFSMEDNNPPPRAVPVGWAKVRYEFQVSGSDVTVLREGKPVSEVFSTTEIDRIEAPSKLHEFLEDIGLSRVDARMICSVFEEGSSVLGVFAPK